MAKLATAEAVLRCGCTGVFLAWQHAPSVLAIHPPEQFRTSISVYGSGVSPQSPDGRTVFLSASPTLGLSTARMIWKEGMIVDAQLQALVDKYRFLWERFGRKLSDINEPYDVDGDTLLHHVARSGGVDEADLLVASGAQINARGDMGYTPLHCAAIQGRPTMVERLLALGADPKLRDEFGQTALTTAQSGGHAEVARLLKRADKNRRD